MGVLNSLFGKKPQDPVEVGAQQLEADIRKLAPETLQTDIDLLLGLVRKHQVHYAGNLGGGLMSFYLNSDLSGRSFTVSPEGNPEKPVYAFFAFPPLPVELYAGNLPLGGIYPERLELVLPRVQFAQAFDEIVGLVRQHPLRDNPTVTRAPG